MSTFYRKPALMVLLTSISLVVFAAAASAQGDSKAKPATVETDNIATLWKIWPKVGQATQFEAALRKHAAWRKSAGEKFAWRVYQPVVGSDLGYYMIRSGSHTWKDMDSNAAWSMQAKADEAYNTAVGGLTDRAEHYFTEVDAKNSNWIDSPDYIYYSFSDFSEKPGMYSDRAEALAKIHKAVTDEKWPYPYAIAYTTGGHGGMTIMTPMRSYAEMADPDPSLMDILTKSLGSESEAKATMKQFNSTIDGMEQTIFVRRVDLSTPD